MGKGGLNLANNLVLKAAENKNEYSYQAWIAIIAKIDIVLYNLL